MKRQIKFRAWDKDCKVIHFMLEQSHKLPLPQPLHTYLENTERFDIMQFTGLQDIKGKDIYEGDIVNIYGGFGYFKNGEGVNVTYIVSFKTCEYSLFRPDINLTWGRLSRLEEMNYKCEIIGNIYENPELLKTTENE